MILSTVLRSPWRPSPTRSSAAVGVIATLARVGIVGSLERGLGIDRKADAAIDGAAVGAAELGTGCAVDEDRLPDHRRVKPAVRVNRLDRNGCWY